MIKLALGVAMVVMLALTGEARAVPGFLDGNTLYALCTSSALGDQGECLGYIKGASDYLEWVRADEHKPQCVPVGTMSQQVVDASVSFLRDHPAIRTSLAAALVVSAITQAWHCQ